MNSKREHVQLFSILDKLNERFRTQLTKTDFLLSEQSKEDMLNSEDIQQKAATKNTS